MPAVAAVLAWASTLVPVQFDLTRSGRHTLPEASSTVLSRMEGPITVTAYMRDQGMLREVVADFIARYQRVKPDLELSFVDPDTAPDEVRARGIGNNELELQYRGRRERVREVSEQVFTNALLRLSRWTERWVAFIEGHGERHPLGQANHDLGEWGRQLGNRGYRVQPLNLAEVNSVPGNTSVLVLAGPRVPLLPGEVRTLLDYLEGGGNLLWLLDPGDPALPDEVAAFLDVRLGSGTVIDAGTRLTGIDDPTMTLVTASLYGSHPALRGFRYTTLFPHAATIESTGDSIWETTPLLHTASHTWLETGPLTGRLDLDETLEQKGPLTIGLSLERDTAGSGPKGPRIRQRVVIIGDGDFLSNTYLANAGNLDLGVRIIDWLSREDELIEIPARTATDTSLEISTVTVGSLGILFLLILPLAFVLSGTLVWWRRRHS